MFASTIQSLIPYLPRYAEEEGDFYSIKRDDLIDKLCEQNKIGRSAAGNTVSFCELLLDTLATLNTDYLEKGEWCFASFPAQLLATSILTAMSDDESRFFAPRFWNTQGVSHDKRDRQRDVLRLIESARNENHQSRQARPIRYCYVAWSLIKLDGKILFYQREDTQKRFDKAAGDYGLIGGRANQTDIAIADRKAVLQALQSPYSECIRQALPNTLKRELREEAGLLFDVHYTFRPWRSLKPYRQVQGAAPNHALTEYYLDIFQIDLTLEGYLHLRRQAETDERLVWFSLADIARGETADGKIPYIKALYDDFGNDRAALEAALSELPDSFASRYRVNRDKYGIIFPVDPDEAVMVGVLGQGKPLNISLNPRHLAVLLGLAGHLRGFEFETVEEGISLHPYGWIEVAGESAIQSELMGLIMRLQGTDLVIENHRDRFFRLSIKPEIVFFDDSLFSYAVKRVDLEGFQTKVPVTISRQGFATAIGRVQEKSEIFMQTLEFAHKLASLEVKPFDEAVKIEDTYKKGLHKEPRFIALGLRNLIRREDGDIKFVLRKAE